MKYIITILMLWGVAFGQCTSADTVTSNSVSSVTPTSAYITGTPAVNDSIFAYTLTYVQIGTTDTVRVTGDDPAAAITGLTNNTAYGYYWRTRCLTNTSIYQLRLYTFRTAQSIVYTPMAAAGYEFKYIKADSGFALPIRDTFVGRGVNRAGLQVWKSGDGLYIYDGTYWRKIGDKYFKFDNNFTVTQVADTFNVFLNNGGAGMASRRLLQATVYLNDSTVVIPDSTFISDNGVTIFVQQDSFLINSEPDDIYRVYAVVVNAANLLDTLKGSTDSFGYVYPVLRAGDILVTWVRVNGTGFDPVEVVPTFAPTAVPYIGYDSTMKFDPNRVAYDGRTFALNTTTPDFSALFEVTGQNGGVLFPRMGTVQMNNIAAPATGLIVYNTTVGAPYYYNGVTWVASTAGSLQQAFSVSGYPQITMGTTDPFAIYFDPFIDNGVTGLSMNPSTKEIILGDSSKGNAGYLSVISGAGISAGGLGYRAGPSKRMVVYDTLTQAIDYQEIPGGGSSQWTDTLTGAITYPGDIYVGGRTLLNGNVGIGVITPAEKLEVAGGIKCDSLKIGGDWFYTIKITLTPTQINTLNSTPVLAIAAPGSGKAIDVISVTARSVFNTTSYASTQYIQVSSNSIPFFQFNNFDVSLGASIGDKAMQIAAVGTAIFLEDTPIYISADADNTDGDSDVSIYINYRVITL